MEAELARFYEDPADTPERCDELLRLLLRLHPANDVRWKAIQAAWKRASAIDKSAQWLKNRARKLEAQDAHSARGACDVGHPAQEAVEKRPDPPSGAASETDRVKELMILALNDQLDHGGSGASGEGLMGAMAKAFGDSFDDHAFHTACEFGRLQNVKMLKECASIDVNFRSGDCSTPLLIAAQNNHLEVCKALIGMDSIELNCRWAGNGCDTPLILAARNGQKELLKALLVRRADANLHNSVGDTALHVAASSGDSSSVQLLLASAASADAQNRKGATPLDVAVDSEVVKLLSESRQIQTLVDSNLASHKVAAAHASAAVWAAQADGRSDFGWELQQRCFRQSPFVWHHHKGLVVDKCEVGFGLKTRLPIQAQEAVLAECAGIPWTLKEIRDPEWVAEYLSGRQQAVNTVPGQEAVPLGAMLEGLWPRTAADLGMALATFPEPVQKVVADAGDPAQEGAMALARCSCNSHHDGTHLSVAFANHSCSPNCEIRGRYHVQLYATRDIKPGEELTIPYLRLTNLLQPRLVRSAVFERVWGSACACARCVSASDECEDDSFYPLLQAIHGQLHEAGAADFFGLASKLAQGELIDMCEPWKTNLAHMVLQDAMQSRLEGRPECAVSPAVLQHLLQAMVAASISLKDIVGESKLLKPYCKTVRQLERLCEEAGGATPEDLLAALQQVHSLESALSGA